MKQSPEETRFQAKTTLVGIACAILLAILMLGGAVYRQDWQLFSFGIGLILFAFIGMIALTNL